MQGRLLLLGDAAHTGPADGQGANLAMEDAAELGAYVRRHGLGPEVRNVHRWLDLRCRRGLGRTGAAFRGRGHTGMRLQDLFGLGTFRVCQSSVPG